MDEKDWKMIRGMLQVVQEHQIWVERHNKTTIQALASTKQRDWKEMLLDGKLPGRTEKLFDPHTHISSIKEDFLISKVMILSDLIAKGVGEKIVVLLLTSDIMLQIDSASLSLSALHATICLSFNYPRYS